MLRPQPSEYAAFFQRYIDCIPDGNFADVMAQNSAATISFFRSIPAEKHNYQYAPGKWTIKDVLVHIIDTERVMGYRALAAGRGDNQSKLALMDENLYAAGVDNMHRSMDSIIAEFAALRTSTELMLSSFTEAQSLQTSNVEGLMTTTRAWAYIIMGHAQHHIHVIQERYL